MKDDDIKSLSAMIARKIEKLIAAGIKDSTLLAVEIKYIIKDFLNQA